MSYKTSKQLQNGTILQGVIGAHAVRVVMVMKGDTLVLYQAVVVLNWVRGVNHPLYKTMTCRPEMTTVLEAWTYGKNIARGASKNVRND